MFQITLSDHVRLSFGSALAAYEGHARAAASLARRSSQSKLALLGLSGVTTVVSAISMHGGYAWQMATAILAAVAFGACAIYVGANQQLLIFGHRSSATRLWMICEKYRALLAEMQADLLDLPELQARRNALLMESAAVIEQAAPDDRYTYEIAKEALSGSRGGGFPDSLIDRYLPPGLRKQSPATSRP